MRRRTMLKAAGAAAIGLSVSPLAAAARRKARLLYFTQHVGYEHSVIRRENGQPSFSEKVLAGLSGPHALEIETSQDGTIFEGDLSRFDAIVLYTCGDLFQANTSKTPPMTPAGVKRLLDVLYAGKPLVAIHSACYWGRPAAPKPLQPFIDLIGGEFIAHGAQQESTMRVVSPQFPGAKGLGQSFRLMDEWYALKNFADDIHVILAEDNAGMTGPMYQRPPFPSTWARVVDKTRVFFTAMGHREDVWTDQRFQQILLGGIDWALGRVAAPLDKNIESATPQAEPPA